MMVLITLPLQPQESLCTCVIDRSSAVLHRITPATVVLWTSHINNCWCSLGSNVLL